MILQKEELTTDTNELLILGSGSAARKELMSSVGLVPDRVEVPNVDETVKPKESPRLYVKRIAAEKAYAISSEMQSYLITADTVVSLGGKVLLKTFDKIKAEEHLRLLSGRRHTVFTAFCVKHNGLISSKLVKTSLKMRLLSEEEISAYIDTREWVGCAGAYRIQGKAKCFFPFISGCYSNVIGLPLPSLINVLNAIGYFKTIK